MRFALLIAAFILTFTQANAYQLQVDAKAAYLYHPATDTHVYSNNADEPIGPASLTKLMSLYLLFEAISNNDLTLDSALPISKKAWKKGGSKMFLEVGKTVKAEDLIRGIIISSGNDACIVLAEYLGGTEDGFAYMMNSKAKQLELKNSFFTNSSGWPDPEQLSSAYDITILSTALIRDFPQFYHYFGETVFTYNNIRQTNRNGLLRQNVGVDGLKTGHTEEDGYHLVASGTQDGERLLAVVLGTDGFAAREGESLKLLRYGFTQYRTQKLWEAWQNVMEIPVWLGTASAVQVVAENDMPAYLPRNKKISKDVTVIYNKSLPAPIAAGDVVGTIRVNIDGRDYESNLVAGHDVAKATGMSGWTQKLFYRFGLEQ